MGNPVEEGAEGLQEPERSKTPQAESTNLGSKEIKETEAPTRKPAGD